MPEKEAAHKINNFITAPQVRVVGDNIEQPEVMSLRDALNKADEMGLDLVEISPKADPYAGSSIIRNSFISRRKRRKRSNRRSSRWWSRRSVSGPIPTTTITILN